MAVEIDKEAGLLVLLVVVVVVVIVRVIVAALVVVIVMVVTVLLRRPYLFSSHVAVSLGLSTIDGGSVLWSFSSR